MLNPNNLKTCDMSFNDLRPTIPDIDSKKSSEGSLEIRD